MTHIDQSREEVERDARAFVKDYMSGGGKDREAAKKILLSQVGKRHDARSKAIQRILEKTR